MKRNSFFALCFLLLATSLALAQDSPPRLPIQADDKEEKKSQSEKLTSGAIEKLLKKFGELERDFQEKKVKLEKEIEAATKDDEKTELQGRIEKLKQEFEGRKQEIAEQIYYLEKVPIEPQSRDARSHLIVPGNCGNLLALPPMDARREAIETLGPPDSCTSYSARRAQIYIHDASPLLQESNCFQSFGGNASGTYSFFASGLTFFTYCNVKGGGCKVYVFIERFPELQALALSLSSRDEILYDICPKSGQRKYPANDYWELLPLIGNPGMEGSYDLVIAGIIGGTMGIGRQDLGLGGLQAVVEASRLTDLGLRNIVLDTNLAVFRNDLEDVWRRINKKFLPAITPALEELSFIKKLKKAISDLSESELRVLVSQLDNGLFGKGGDKEYSAALKEIAENLAKKNIKDAEKSAKNFLKKLKKREDALWKEIKPIYEPLNRAARLINQFEFVASGDALSAILKSLPKNEREEAEGLVAEYRKAASGAKDRLETLKSGLVKQLADGEFAEPVPVYAGEELLLLVSFVGATYDFETQETRFKFLLASKFVPASADGAISVEAMPMTGLLAGLLDIDELIAAGFEEAILETRGRITIVSSVRRKNGAEIGLRFFSERDGVTKKSISMQELKENGSQKWLPVLLPKDEKARKIPQDDTRFLSTFRLLDKDSNQLTVAVLSLKTQIKLVVAIAIPEQEGKKEALELNCLLFPGLYENQITAVDALNPDPKKRFIKLPPVYFRILAPESK